TARDQLPHGPPLLRDDAADRSAGGAAEEGNQEGRGRAARAAAGPELPRPALSRLRRRMGPAVRAGRPQRAAEPAFLLPAGAGDFAALSLHRMVVRRLAGDR